MTGVGWGNLRYEFGELAWARYRNPRIAGFDHPHDQLISALANSGLPGLVAWCAVLVVPARHCWRAAWRSSDVEQRSIGAAGLAVVLGFAVFGLTEAIFEQVLPLLFFAVVVALLMSQLTPPGDVAGSPGCVDPVADGARRADVTGG
jgi:O-antigen ligase